MARDPRYDILFEPVQIGPVTAKNRFYQVPHCNGGGYRDPSAAAEMRKTKAEGGWGVVFTEQCEMHHTSEITPFIELRLWDDADIPMLAKMADSIHEYGALAGIQLAYSGINGPNLYTKEVPRAPTALPIRTFTNDPVQARAMDLEDIRDLQALAPQRLQARQGSRLRLGLPLWRPRFRHHPALPFHRHQPAQRRVRRQSGKPFPPDAGAGGGGQGRHRRQLRHHLAALPRRGHRRARHFPTASSGT